MEYVKKKHIDAETYEHMQVAEEVKQGYFDQGWEEATLEEWEAQMAPSVASDAESHAIEDDVDDEMEEEDELNV